MYREFKKNKNVTLKNKKVTLKSNIIKYNELYHIIFSVIFIVVILL